MVEVCFCGSVSEEDTCVEVVGDCYVWDESEIFTCLLLNCTVYLCELVFVAPFFPPNESFCFFFLLILFAGVGIVAVGAAIFSTLCGGCCLLGGCSLVDGGALP